MAAKPGAPRRKHSLELKAAVVEECRRPGVSVAAIALAHGLNANLVHQWMRNARADVVDKPGFVEVKMPVPSAVAPVAVVRDIRIELRRGATSISVLWPTEAAAQCAAWLGELLR